MFEEISINFLEFLVAISSNNFSLFLNSETRFEIYVAIYIWTHQQNAKKRKKIQKKFSRQNGFSQFFRIFLHIFHILTTDLWSTHKNTPKYEFWAKSEQKNFWQKFGHFFDFSQKFLHKVRNLRTDLWFTHKTTLVYRFWAKSETK